MCCMILRNISENRAAFNESFKLHRNKANRQYCKIIFPNKKYMLHVLSTEAGHTVIPLTDRKCQAAVILEYITTSFTLVVSQFCHLPDSLCLRKRCCGDVRYVNTEKNIITQRKHTKLHPFCALHYIPLNSASIVNAIGLR